MLVSFTPEIIERLAKIKTKNKPLFKRIQKQLGYFVENERHPSLRTHKLKGSLENTWSISVEGNIRMLYFLEKDRATFFLIGTHDEVYRK